ncbi:membrane protein of ER body-like protein isoform X2 [Ananas comosus]|uniref:Membrane protein of ER body-like protein isoform X2 n=1 Tax=Ananas comosus TaxID=4615 RepID=A0A6P5HCM5_ANACO|nr:membrane protein of ER body-like protein isoform X2 [Ananas comosus]
MEVEEERKWGGVVGEEVVEEEEVVVGLERKRRDKGIPGKEANGAESLEIEEEEEEEEVVDLDGGGGAGVGEEARSVYFDSEKGVWKCRHCNWTYKMSGPSSRDYIPNHAGYCQMAVDAESLPHIESFYASPTKGTEVTDIAGMESIEDVQFGARKDLTNGGTESREEVQFDAKKDLTNGHVSSQANELNRQDVIFIRDANGTSKNVIVENGSYAKTSSEGSSYSEITQNDDGVIVQKQITLLKSSKVILPDFDLERVLEEQDTHDLFCPNCNSCITKRVILRKRKRWIKGIQYDMPPKRIHEADPILALPPIDDQGPPTEPPECFRCLSCLSFFFPTEGGGWNIFRLCGGKEETPNRQSSTHISERFKLWIPSIFQPVPSHNEVSRQEPRDDPTLRGWQSPEDSTAPGAETSNQNQITIENSDAGTVLPRELPVPRKQQEPALEEKQTAPQQPIREFEAQPSQPSTRGEKQDNWKINADFQAPDGFNISSEPGKEPAQNTVDTSQPEAVAGDYILVDVQTRGDAIIPVPEIPESEPIQVEATREPFEWDILKAIVYGGLVESIASLSIVSSAAASGASTLNIFVLAVANLISGLFLIVHNIFELRKEHDEATDHLIQNDFDRYRDTLGKRPHFVRHLIVAVLSYIIVGTLPPLVYGFSFRKSSNTEHKLIAVAAASLLCVALLAIGKAHIRLPRKYIATMLYYLSLGVTASGLSYVAGVMLNSLIEQLGLFNDHTSPAPPPPSLFRDLSSGKPAWASY